MHKSMRLNSLNLIKFISILSLFFVEINTSKAIFANENKINSIESNNSNIQDDYYLLGPGDEIAIEFIGADELSGKFVILSDGKIQLPLLGTQSINGLSLDQAKEKLTLLFSEELISPRLNINLIKARPLKISLIGEIYRPGIYSLNVTEAFKVEGTDQVNSLTGYPTVIDAIQKSGGLTFDADISKITLYRKLHDKKDQYKKLNLNLLSMFQTGEQKYNPYLFDGDIIEISRLVGDKNSLENVANNLIPEKINIYVVGEVIKPGMFSVDPKTTVEKAILLAGGPIDWRYQKNNVNLFRVQRNGQLTRKKVSYKENQLYLNNKKVALRSGDVIKVNKNLFGKSTDALGTVLDPIQNMFSIYTIYKVLND